MCCKPKFTTLFLFSFYIFSITLPAVRISLLFKSELWYSRFYWSRSTKDPADPYWFVVVLPSQVFLSYHQLPSPQSIKYRASHQHVQLQIFRETFSWWLLFRFWPPWEIVIDSFSVTCLLFNLWERLSSVAVNWNTVSGESNEKTPQLPKKDGGETLCHKRDPNFSFSSIRSYPFVKDQNRGKISTELALSRLSLVILFALLHKLRKRLKR